MSLPPQPGQPNDPQQGQAHDPYQQQPNAYPPPQNYSVDPAANQPPAAQPQYGQPPAGPPQPAQPHYDQATSQFQQPPHGQPGPPTGQFQPYGQQPQSFQDKLKAMPPKKLGLIAGGGGGGLLLLIIILIIATSGGGPSDVVEDYMGAVADGDIESAIEYQCESDKGFVKDDDSQEEIDKIVADMDWEVTYEHVAGNEAEVEVKVTGSKEIAGEFTAGLELREGDWFICEMGSS